MEMLAQMRPLRHRSDHFFRHIPGMAGHKMDPLHAGHLIYRFQQRGKRLCL